MSGATLTRHPARYSRSLLPTLHQWLGGLFPVLDPMAGIGASGIEGLIHSELEPEWAQQCPRPVVAADACSLPFPANTFAAVVTSPTYGNRMADHHNARDDSRRNTYRHALGRPLNQANTGQLQWGPGYRAVHRRIWREVLRVLRPGGTFVLNISDHPRAGKMMPVTDWHLSTLEFAGFELVEHCHVETPRNRFGANGELRAEHESLIRLCKPSERPPTYDGTLPSQPPRPRTTDVETGGLV